MSDHPLIRLRGIRKRYGTHEVLRGVDLDVPAGQTVSIIGPSGSGKSTLLRLVMMLDRPDAGWLEIDGEAPWPKPGHRSTGAASKQALRRARAKVGMVFQHFNLFPHMSALGNVMEAPVRVLGLRAAEAQARAMDYLDRVGLRDKAQQYPWQLSGGQRQRVAIARALANEPLVILADEPTGNLDTASSARVQETLGELVHRRDKTVVAVTHDPQFARAGDRVIRIVDGRIESDA